MQPCGVHVYVGTTLHATQPGLSKQLKALEDELGFPVFLRNGKRLTGLTELGSEVAQRARKILR